jgi:hypothetical protein
MRFLSARIEPPLACKRGDRVTDAYVQAQAKGVGACSQRTISILGHYSAKENHSLKVVSIIIGL